MEKLRAFAKISDIIKKDIRQFWTGVDVKEDKLTLDGDQIIMIFVYIASKTVVNNLHAHLAFCKEFSTPFIKTTRLGYCLTTMEIALTLLAEEEAFMVDSEEVKAEEADVWQQRTRSVTISLKKSLVD